MNGVAAMSLVLAICSVLLCLQSLAEVPRHLPGELDAESVLNGNYPFPPSPVFGVKEDATGFAADRLGKVPAAGTHPRVLFGPDEIPDIRHRLRETQVGKALQANLNRRLDAAIRKKDFWGTQLYISLVSGDVLAANKLLDEHKGPPPDIGHYQPFIPACLAMEAFDALINEDQRRGEAVGRALGTYARLIQPLVENALSQPMNDDVWRVQVNGPATGAWTDKQGSRSLIGYHLLGYAYDFAYNYMSVEDRAAVRRLISSMTNGRLWLGARLPHHFRNWNWIAVGLSQPLLALSIEGEEGYDPRVYKLGVEIAQDYYTYAISLAGCSTEAVGYTQFGFVWGVPFTVAAARRGDNLMLHGHHRAMIDWYFHSKEPHESAWQSHGDGGVVGPALWTMAMWKRFFPDDPKIDFLWLNTLKADGKDALQERVHQIEAMIWAGDPGVGYSGQALASDDPLLFNLPLTWFDPLRSSLMTRSDWTPNAAAMQFECRTDSVGASHEHADRGGFTFTALGHRWATESFRSVETRHHSSILIDGLGQGYWPGPGRWIGHIDSPWAILAACDAKAAYDWWWPKQIVAEDPSSFEHFQFPRWASYKLEAEKFRKNFPGIAVVRDDRPSVVNFWTGFESHGARLWDEDAWPVKLPHNPVARAFRSMAFVRGSTPYALIVDDIQKDDQPRLYEWQMICGMGTDLASIKDRDILLCSAGTTRNSTGLLEAQSGTPMLLVRILEIAEPTDPIQYQAKPSVRMESFEKKDTLGEKRTFGSERRLVIPARAVAPEFKILLFPHRMGDPLPKTEWSDDRTVLTIQTPSQNDSIRFQKQADGRTDLVLSRRGEKDLGLSK